MIVWLGMDPDSGRITAQAAEFGDGHLPPGVRGKGWKMRRGSIPDAVWADLLAGKLTDEQQDQAHKAAWSRGKP